MMPPGDDFFLILQFHENNIVVNAVVFDVILGVHYQWNTAKQSFIVNISYFFIIVIAPTLQIKVTNNKAKFIS